MRSFIFEKPNPNDEKLKIILLKFNFGKLINKVSFHAWSDANGYMTRSQGERNPLDI